MLPKSRMLESFEVSCDLPRPVRSYRRSGGRARKEQSTAGGDGGHAPRYSEHVNTPSPTPHPLPRPPHSARYRYRHVHLTSPLSEWRLSIMTCVNYDVCQYRAAIAERSVYARHDYLLTFISFSFIFLLFLLRHD